MHIDKELIALCCEGNRKAQYRLYEYCYSPLMSVCSRYTINKDDAHAHLNLGFLKILSGLGQYDDKKPFVAWIKRIMINTIIDEYRRAKNHLKPHMPEEFSKVVDGTSSVMNEVETYISDEELNSYVQRLPPMSRQVFNLYAIDGFQHKEIAGMLEISVGTSKWHLSFARQRLKESLERVRSTSKVG